MGRYLTIGAIVVLFVAVIYLGAVVAEQQRAIEALVDDNATSLELQAQFGGELRELRQQVQQGRSDRPN